MVPVGGVLARILAEGEKDAEVPRSDSGFSGSSEEQKKPEEPRGTPNSEEPAEQQRRSTDKKESVKHTTGEYHEAMIDRYPDLAGIFAPTSLRHLSSSSASVCGTATTPRSPIRLRLSERSVFTL